MDDTPAPAPLQVYTSDVLLLLTTFISLAFRACRQGIEIATAGEDAFRPERGTDERSNTSSPPPRPHPVAEDEGAPEQRASAATPATEAAPSTRESSDADEPILPVNLAADPLLILAERLTLEEKLSTAVNWLSLVSNCLTYFLRPSQVLYTFLFTNGDFVLFVTSYSNRYQRLHPASYPPPCTLPDEALASLRRPSPQPQPQPHGALRGLADEFGGGGDEDERRRAALLRSCTEAVPVSVPPPPRPSFVSSGAGGPRHRDGALRSDLYVSGPAKAHAATQGLASLGVKGRGLSLSRLLPHLRHYASRCLALAQTQLSWLLLLNAVLTCTLFVFHLHHLFFNLGTLFGYLAALASVYLCGMEGGCIVVRVLRRRQHPSQQQQHQRRSFTSSNVGALAGRGDSGSDGDGADEAESWDPSSGIHGPHWAFVGEHVSAAACSALYVWMLLDEGDALWSSHVDLMRWYVCSCALMLLSVLKCLRVVI